MDAFGFLSLVYSISLQIRLTPVTNNIFPFNSSPVFIKPSVGQGLKFPYHIEGD